jgi:hypothetical protein
LRNGIFEDLDSPLFKRLGPFALCVACSQFLRQILQTGDHIAIVREVAVTTSTSLFDADIPATLTFRLIFSKRLFRNAKLFSQKRLSNKRIAKFLAEKVSKLVHIKLNIGRLYVLGRNIMNRYIAHGCTHGV